MWQDAPDGTYGNYIWNNELANRMFLRPSAIDIEKKYQETKKAHPYLLVTEDTVRKIHKQAETDAEYARWLAALRKKAVTLQKLPPEDFSDPAWSRLFHIRHVKDRAELLGLFYLTDQDDRFAERLWEEIRPILEMPDWSTAHYLNTAELCFAVSITYDWLYGYLDQKRRKALEEALWSKALLPALEGYREANGIGPDFLNHLEKKAWWSRCSSNWNMVCNGGVICGALALADTDARSFALMEYALKGLPYTILQYLPDGGSEESVGYWAYAFSYFCKSMAALESALGTEYGYFKQPLMKQTVAYPIAMTGPAGTFNFHDSGINAAADIPEMFYFSSRLQMPEVGGFRRNLLSGGRVSPSVYDLIWYEPNGIQKCNFPCDWYFRGSETVSMRTSWDADALAAGFHTGNNDACHSHLDMGSIIVDFLGERWFCDPGNENITYSEAGAHINRWDLYRMRAEGHNTLVMNPAAGPDQNPDAHCRIDSCTFGSDRSTATADLSAACGNCAVEWRRTVTLDKINRTLTVCDDLQSGAANEIYWFAHTEAECSISDNGKEALLTKKGKQVLLKLFSPSDARFILMPASPLPGSPHISGQESNAGIRKLALHLSGTKSVFIKVLLQQA